MDDKVQNQPSHMPQIAVFFGLLAISARRKRRVALDTLLSELRKHLVKALPLLGEDEAYPEWESLSADEVRNVTVALQSWMDVPEMWIDEFVKETYTVVKSMQSLVLMCSWAE